jgi:hypothetical protein
VKRGFASPDTAGLGLLKNMLHKASIRCVEINEQMAQTIPAPPFQAGLRVQQMLKVRRHAGSGRASPRG